MTHIIQRIQEDMKLNINEVYILQYMLDNLHQITQLSSRQLAIYTNTNPMAVIRLARKLGYSSYSDFKYNIQELFNRYSIKNTEMTKKDNMDMIINKITEIEINIMNTTKSILNKKDMSEIVDLLKNTLYIDIIANDANSEIAKYITHHFCAVGKITNVYHSIDTQILHSSIVPSDHIVFILTKGANNSYMRDILLKLKERNIQTILITGYRKSRLSPICTYTIHTVYEPTKQLGNFVFHVSIKYLFDLIFGLLYVQDFDHNQVLENIHQNIYQRNTKT